MLESPVLHVANKNYSSWSLRPWVLLVELGIPFEERAHRFGPDQDFGRFSPSGTVPCLEDGDVRVWDSMAIAEYVAEDHPAVWPADRAARAWARSAAAEMHGGYSALRAQCSMSCGQRIRLHQVNEALERDLGRLDACFADGLARFGGPFLAGAAFTAVDAFFAPVAFRILTYDPPLAERSRAYAAHLRGLRSMEAWYEAALAETHRDEPHERDILRWGTVTADHRSTA